MKIKIIQKHIFIQKNLLKVSKSFEFGVALSTAYTTIDRGNHKPSPGLGFLATYHSKHLILDLHGDYIPGDYHHGIFQLFAIRFSGLYPLQTTKNAPFIGGSAAFSGIRLTYSNPNSQSYFTDERADGMGFTIYLNAGYLFNRNLKVNYRLVGSFFYPFYKTEVYASSETRIPLGFMINFAVMF